MKLINERVKEQLQKLFILLPINLCQESVITIRGDRYCVPVKQEYRNNFPGIIHDQSSTGATLFIEPMTVVQMNNQLREFM